MSDISSGGGPPDVPPGSCPGCEEPLAPGEKIGRCTSCGDPCCEQCRTRYAEGEILCVVCEDKFAQELGKD